MKSNEPNMNNEVVSNNKAILDQNNIPIEQLFGSVTTYNNVEGSESKSQQLRTSARVFKKMKLDSVVSSSVVLETKKEETKPEVKRLWRPTWSQEDKNLFFEALNEYGKDFESIYYYISNKLRRKGLPESVMKTKDQIRHFYYRTWHKISKHLKFGDDIKKNAQELYGLINYGELRKKIGSVSEKNCMKLNELIYRGNVAIRLKGKTVRVKTPMCRALRNLNQLDEKHDDLKLPTRVIVNLVPKDMNAWLKVQGVAQNPRVRAALPLQRRLSTLINHLNSKWRSVSEIAYDDVLNAYNSTTDVSTDNKPTEDTKTTLDPLLRLSPPPKANIEFPTVNLSEYLTSQSICLNAFEERIGVTTPGEQLWIPKGGLKKTGTKRSRNDSTNDKILPSVSLQKTASLASIDSNENCIPGEEAVPSNKVVTEMVPVLPTPAVETVEEKVDEIKVEDIKEEDEKKLQDISNVRKGWTPHSCGTVTIGELYIMFGSNSNLTLEYSWDNLEKIAPKIETDPEEISSVEEKVQEPNGDLTHKTQDTIDDNNVSGTLQRLLSIAKLHYRKNIVRCPCGHTCGTNSKSNNIVHEKSANTKNIKTVIGEKSVDSLEKTLTTELSSVVNTGIVSSVVPIIIQSSHQPVNDFRQPMAPNLDSFRAQLHSIQRRVNITPRYCNRRGRRPRSKQVVVERQLPLMPNKINSEHQIVQMNIISPNNHGPRLIAPKILNIDKSEHSISNAVGVVSNPIEAEGACDINLNFGVTETNLSAGASTSAVLDITDNAVTPSRVGSPTSISNLLDIALATSDVNLDEEGRDESGVPSFMGFLSSNIINSTPPTSPSRILKENDNQWLNSEVADFSLSSFLGHLESPIKASQSGTTSIDDTHMSQDVDAQLQSLLTDTSVDYMAKFADLAARVDHK